MIREDCVNHEEYLKNHLENSDYFYPIDINSWNQLMNYYEAIPDYINNSKIAEEIIILKEEDKYRKIEKEKINKIEEINCKNARLKKGMKYKKDFVIICARLYEVLINNFKIDYIIKIKKIQELIDLNNIEDKADKEFIMKENLLKEKLDKFIIDMDKGYISKIIKYDLNHENEGKYILNELDFYPIQVYVKTFGVLVREVEKAKKKYKELEKQMQYNLLSDEEKRKS